MKSAIGIGALLLDGLGDTIRVSLTEDPEFEMEPCRQLAVRQSIRALWVCVAAHLADVQPLRWEVVAAASLSSSEGPYTSSLAASCELRSACEIAGTLEP